MATARPVFLNGVSSTVQAGSSAIGSATATGVNVATGDGAKFGSLGTDEFIPAMVVDTSTNPETIKEFVYITARSTDALTVVRQAEDSSTYAASTTSIQSGYTIAAVALKVALGMIGAMTQRYTKPDGVLFETMPRSNAVSTSTGAVFSGGKLMLTAIWLPAGLKVSNIGFASIGTGQTTPSNWWFGLYDSSRVQLAVTADQTTTVWAANVFQQLAVATIATGSASSFTTTYAGLHYLGVMQNAGTGATLSGAATTASAISTPSIFGISDTTQTSPPAFPHTATAPSTTGSFLYGTVA